MTSLETLQEAIRGCRRCVDAGHLSTARPLTLGSVDAPFLLIGQAPSRTDALTGATYSGPAGLKLREWLRTAGFADEDFGTRIYPAAITKCFPGRLPGSSKDRVPSRAEQALCRSWLDAELERIDPKVVILFGGLAIKTFVSSEPLEKVIGRRFDKDGRVWVPLPHASGASTWLNDPAHRLLLDDALELLSEIRAAL